eukprot:763739-Hanusia_phi.AAC.3
MREDGEGKGRRGVARDRWGKGKEWRGGEGRRVEEEERGRQRRGDQEGSVSFESKDGTSDGCSASNQSSDGNGWRESERRKEEGVSCDGDGDETFVTCILVNSPPDAPRPRPLRPPPRPPPTVSNASALPCSQSTSAKEAP